MKALKQLIIQASDADYQTKTLILRKKLKSYFQQEMLVNQTHDIGVGKNPFFNTSHSHKQISSPIKYVELKY